MAKIYSKNKDYSGISASVHFIDGVGETNDKYLIEWFKKHGYEVEKAEVDDDEPSLDDLKAEADKLGIEYPANIGYNKLLQKINAKKAEE